MRLDKRFKSPKILRGQIVTVPEKVSATYGPTPILPGRYIVLSTHPFGIIVSPVDGNEIYGVRWEFTDKWEKVD